MGDVTGKGGPGVIREIFVELLKYLKLGEGMAWLYRTPIDPNYRETLANYVKNRDANFLEIVRRVLEKPSHPYAQLFGLAGCTYADVETAIRRDGLEPTLGALAREGVYLSLDEFRCNTEIVRGGRHIPASMKDWDTADGAGPFQNFSSGSSSGRSLRTSHSLQYAKYGMAGGQVLVDHFYRDKKTAVIVLLPILPTSMGLGTCVGVARLGYTAERWFALGGSMRGNGHYRTMTTALVTRLRLGGAKVPYPTYLQADDFSPVAEFIARRKKEGVQSAMSGMVSSITRVAAVALDRGLDIRGSFALVTGESLTDAKREIIEAAGIEVFPSYGTSEFGGIGTPCSRMNKGNCVHIQKGSVALISRRLEDDGYSDEAVDSLHITSLLSFAPRILINVEIGDTGVIEKATCDCDYARLGYDMQVRDIAAISKIRGQGYTLRAPLVVRLVEEGLAQRFGGRTGDYQLLEVEGKAQTEMVLRIHPRAGVESPEQVLEYFLAECRRTYGGSMTVLQWTESHGVRVEVKEPVLASSGKFRAIRLLGSQVRAPQEEPAPDPVRKAATAGSGQA